MLILLASAALWMSFTSVKGKEPPNKSVRLLGVTDKGSELEDIFNWTQDRLSFTRHCNITDIELEIIDCSEGISETVNEILTSIFAESGLNDTSSVDEDTIVILLYTRDYSEIYNRIHPVLPHILVERVKVPSIAPTIRAAMGLMNKLSWGKGEHLLRLLKK
ncbi:unnamed protein product [Lepeophtheirus salmonis]|uniref:(salmon louse) hypothetical protein n=2 Tax=Lepeophtheirus salmonis TaxID=72036 RepID=A0A7R8D6G4_LEPSM|nr:unnamed protein product [Lepeophtheirus salmonis]CAF3017349.1 unnamed protein product [Lepeophtheirus salmonis]